MLARRLPPLRGYFPFLGLLTHQGKQVRQESSNSPRPDGIFHRSTLQQGPFHQLNVGYWFAAALLVSFSLPIPLHSSLPFFFVSPPSELFLNPEHQQRVLTPNSSTQGAAHININLGEEPEFIFIYLFLSPLSDREFWRFPQLQPLLCCRGLMLPHLFTLRTQRFINTRA